MSRLSERVKKWRNEHRVLWNSRMRIYRRNKSFGVAEQRLSKQVAENQSKMDGLRELLAGQDGEPKQVMEKAKPEVYRDDFGRIISQKQWYLMMEHKAKAREKGYEIDEFTQ